MNADHAAIIDGLKGPKAVSIEVQRRRGGKGPSPQAVSNWRNRGIPWKLRPVIADMAREANVPVPPKFLLGDI